MPNLHDPTGHSAYPASLDTAGTFLPMYDYPLAGSTLALALDENDDTISVEDCGKFADGPGLVTIEGTWEIIYYAAKSEANGPGQLTGCLRNWGNNVRHLPVTVANVGSQYFQFKGDYRSLFPVGLRFTVIGSTGNDCTPGDEYIVLSAVLAGGDTRINLDGAGKAIVSAVADGTIFPASLGIGSAATLGTRIFHLLGAEPLRIITEALLALETLVGTSLSSDPGSHEYRLTALESGSQGVIFAYGLLGVDVAVGVSDGDVVFWDAGASKFDQCDPASDVPLGTVAQVSNDYAIADVDTAADWFKIAGDHRSEFPSGATFSVGGSTGNDGAYTSTGVSYDGGADQTRIDVAEDITDSTVDGTITVSAWLLTLGGRDSGHTGLTPGSAYYLDAGAAGQITLTQNEWFVGVAYDTTSLLVSIRRETQWPQVIKGQTLTGGVANREVVYWNGSAYAKADRDAGQTSGPVGVAINVSGGTGDIVIRGPVSGYSSLTAGAKYWLSSTAGAIASTGPSSKTGQGWLVGHAVSTTVLFVNVQRSPVAWEVGADPADFDQISGSTVQAVLDDVDDFLDSLTYSQISATDPATNATGAEIERLTDGSDASSAPSLHHHDSHYDGRYLHFNISVLGPTTAPQTVLNFRVPTGKTAKVHAYGGNLVKKRSGTIAWDVYSDTTLITITSGNTTGVEVGDVIFRDAGGAGVPPQPIGQVTSIVSSSQLRVTPDLTGSASGVDWWLSEDNDHSNNGIYWNAWKLTASNKTTWINKDLKGNYHDVSGGGWTAAANSLIVFQVIDSDEDAENILTAWVQLEIY